MSEAAAHGDAAPAAGLPWNAHLGWALLLGGFVLAIGLDPWSLSEQDPARIVGSTRMYVRLAQSVMIGMGFLQLLVAQVLMTAPFGARARALASWGTGLGSALYTAGYFLLALRPGLAWVIPAAAVLNLAGLSAILVPTVRGRRDPGLSLILAILALGMLLDVTAGLFATRPETFFPDFLGPEDGLRQRMLRLARAAAVALAVLSLLIRGLAEREPDHPAARWGPRVLLAGMAGMPLILMGAAFTSVLVKFLLPLPATAVFSGTLVGAWLARRHGNRLELTGWLVIAASMGVGLLIGMYAFDGPLPSPMGGYNAFPRRLSRLDHAYSIVLGMTCLFAGRWQAVHRPTPGFERLASPLLVGGTVVTISGVLLVGVAPLSPAALGVGPTLIVAALIALFLCRGEVTAT